MSHHSRARLAATAVLTGAAALAPLALSAAPAEAAVPTVDWGPIIACESGGNPTAHNPSSTASGLFQFLTSSWLAYGGGRYAPTAAQASPAQQTEIANNAFAVSGLSPWAASQHCWGGKVNTSGSYRPPAPAPRPAPRAAPRPAPRPAATPHPAVSGVRAADGTGRYVCTPDKLYFAACDPDTLGQVESYPPYDGRAAAAPRVAPVAAQAGSYTVRAGDTLSGIAAAHHTSWRAIYQANRGRVVDPNLIYVGQSLAL